MDRFCRVGVVHLLQIHGPATGWSESRGNSQVVHACGDLVHEGLQSDAAKFAGSFAPRTAFGLFLCN